MSHLFRSIIFSVIFMAYMPAVFAQALQAPEITLEQVAQDRVLKIVDKLDPNAIVQVRVKMKAVSAKLPGAFSNSRVVPQGNQGELLQDSVASVSVRIITEISTLPEWVKAEVAEALKFSSAKVDVSYVVRKDLARAKGSLENLPQLMNKFSTDLSTGITNGMSTSLTKSLSTEFSQSLEKSLTNSLNSTLPNTFSTKFSESLEKSLTNSLEKSLTNSLTSSLTTSLNATLPNAMSKVGSKTPVDATTGKPQEHDPNSALAVSSLKEIKIGIWGLGGAVFVAILLLAAAIFMLGSKVESALMKTVETKLGPLLQGGVGGSASSVKLDSDGSDDGYDEYGEAGPGSSEGAGKNGVTDLSMETLLNLFADCYWTKQDRYAQFLWTEMSQQQRKDFLALPEVKQLYVSYLSYIRQFTPVNLGHHTDARYLTAISKLRFLSQQDLAKWLMENREFLPLLTPLRWEYLPISLSDRVTMTVNVSEAMANGASAQLDVSKVVVSQRSAPRELPMPLDVKSISAEDEIFIWNNAQTLPAYMRTALSTLVWLAISPIETRKKVLGEFNARELAEGWIGPDEVLEALKEALPSKKLGMLQSYLNEIQPSRNSDVYRTLVAQGIAELAKLEPGSSNGSGDSYERGEAA